MMTYKNVYNITYQKTYIYMLKIYIINNILYIKIKTIMIIIKKCN